MKKRLRENVKRVRAEHALEKKAHDEKRRALSEFPVKEIVGELEQAISDKCEHASLHGSFSTKIFFVPDEIAVNFDRRYSLKSYNEALRKRLKAAHPEEDGLAESYWQLAYEENVQTLAEEISKTLEIDAQAKKVFGAYAFQIELSWE